MRIEECVKYSDTAMGLLSPSWSASCTLFEALTVVFHSIKRSGIMKPEKNNNRFKPEGGSPPRMAFHVAIAVVGWILFAYFWRVVGERGLSPGAVISLIAMATFLAIVITMTTLWIVHNLKISRNDRRTGTRPVAEVPYYQDKIGHTIEGEGFDSLKSADMIEVAVEDGKKIYRRAKVGSERAENLSS